MKRRTFLQSIIGGLTALFAGEKLVAKTPKPKSPLKRKGHKPLILVKGTNKTVKWRKWPNLNKEQKWTGRKTFIETPSPVEKLIVYKNRLYITTENGCYVTEGIELDNPHSKRRGWKKISEKEFLEV